MDDEIVYISKGRIEKVKGPCAAHIFRFPNF